MIAKSFVFFALLGASLAVDVLESVSCPSEGQYFYSHPYKCALFVECNNGAKVEQECIGGLIFNPQAGFCDFPDNYACEDKEEPTTPPPTGPVGECPAVNGEYVDFLTDATRCEVFYMCNWGTAIQMECPAGLHFNPELNVCDYPYRAGCAVGQQFLIH